MMLLDHYRKIEDNFSRWLRAFDYPPQLPALYQYTELTWSTDDLQRDLEIYEQTELERWEEAVKAIEEGAKNFIITEDYLLELDSLRDEIKRNKYVFSNTDNRYSFYKKDLRKIHTALSKATTSFIDKWESDGSDKWEGGKSFADEDYKEHPCRTHFEQVAGAFRITSPYRSEIYMCLWRICLHMDNVIHNLKKMIEVLNDTIMESFPDLDLFTTTSPPHPSTSTPAASDEQNKQRKPQSGKVKRYEDYKNTVAEFESLESLGRVDAIEKTAIRYSVSVDTVERAMGDRK